MIKGARKNEKFLSGSSEESSEESSQKSSEKSSEESSEESKEDSKEDSNEDSNEKSNEKSKGKSKKETVDTASVSPAVSCSNPCYLKSSVDSIRSRVPSDVTQVKGVMGGIPAVCDVRTNYCCATDFPLSSLCYRLGISG